MAGLIRTTRSVLINGVSAVGSSIEVVTSGLNAAALAAKSEADAFSLQVTVGREEKLKRALQEQLMADAEQKAELVERYNALDENAKSFVQEGLKTHEDLLKSFLADK